MKLRHTNVVHVSMLLVHFVAFTNAAVYNLTILHTADILGRVMPVHGWGTECALVPATEGGSCVGVTNAQSCVLERPFCVMIGACRSCSGGFAARVKYFEDMTLAEENTLRIDGGNIYFGTLWYTKFRGAGINSFLSSAMFSDDTNHTTVPMYDSMLAGNLDFVDGPQVLVDILKTNPTPRIMSNYDWRKSSILNSCTLPNGDPCFKDYDIVVKNGRRIGVIGMVTKFLHERSQAPEEVTILDSGDYITTLNRLVFQITEAHPDCNIIVVNSGMLSSENELMAIKVPGVDVIIEYRQGSGEYPKILPNLVTGTNVYIVSNENKGQTIGTLALSFDDNGKTLGHDPIKSKDYAPVTNFVDSVAQIDGVYDAYAWQLTKLQAGDIEVLKTQVVGTVKGEVDALFTDDADYDCMEAIIKEDAAEACDADNPLVTWFTVDEGNLCCPYKESDNRRCASSSCEPIIDEATDTWSFPTSQNGKVDACCPDRALFDRGCCPMDAMFKVYGCRHSECPFGSTMGDAIMQECTDCDFTINVGGGYRKTLGDIGQDTSDVTYADVLQALPYQNTLVTFKARPTTIIEALQWSIEGYKPLVNEGKLIQVSGLRWVWNPSSATVIKAEACSFWDRTLNRCTGRWVDILEDRTRLFKVATSNFVESGGAGFSMLTKSAAKVFEPTNVGITFAEMMQNFLAANNPYEARSKDEIQTNCNGYIHNYVEHFAAHPECRMLKAVVESPYKCPQDGMANCLAVGNGQGMFSINGLQLIENGTCSECSGFGECNTDFYTCDCQPTLIKGFEFPQQYRMDGDDESNVEAICRGSGSGKSYPGVKLARGPACSEFRQEYSMPSSYTALIVLCGILNITLGIVSSLFYEKKKRHAIVRASQRICMHFVSLGSVTAGVMCFVAASKPSSFTCNAFPLLGSVSLALLIAPLCVKSQVVLALFNNKKLRTVKVSDAWNAASIISVALLEVVLCIVLSVIAPYKPTVVVMSPNVAEWSYGVFCDSRDPTFGISTAVIWIIPLLSVNALLVLVALYYTLRTRNIPSIFNESKHMGFCVYNTLIISASALPTSFMFPTNPPMQSLLLVLSVTIVMVSSLSILLVTKVLAIRSIPDSLSVADVLFGSKGSKSAKVGVTANTGAASTIPTANRTSGTSSGTIRVAVS